MGERIIIEPSFRYYHQEAADYYKTSLDDTGITPALQPVGEGSHYSADYRISKLHAKTAGLKLTYIHQENLIIDLSFDRYKMEGLDTKTSKTYYPKASITTAGFSGRSKVCTRRMTYKFCDTDFRNLAFKAMGTNCGVIYRTEGAERDSLIGEEILKFVRYFEGRYSRYDSESLISLINTNGSETNTDQRGRLQTF